MSGRSEQDLGFHFRDWVIKILIHGYLQFCIISKVSTDKTTLAMLSKVPRRNATQHFVPSFSLTLGIENPPTEGLSKSRMQWSGMV